jgi:hypothetical protein
MLEGEFHGGDLFVGAVGEVGDGAFFDFAGFAIGMAQQMTDVGFAALVGGSRIDMHSGYYVYHINSINATTKPIEQQLLVSTKTTPKSYFLHSYQQVIRKHRWNIRYKEAVDELKSMGLDPDKIEHRRPDEN